MNNCSTATEKNTIKVFYLPTAALCISLRNVKIYIKTYIKIAPACFGL